MKCRRRRGSGCPGKDSAAAAGLRAPGRRQLLPGTHDAAPAVWHSALHAPATRRMGARHSARRGQPPPAGVALGFGSLERNVSGVRRYVGKVASGGRRQPQGSQVNTSVGYWALWAVRMEVQGGLLCLTHPLPSLSFARRVQSLVLCRRSDRWFVKKDCQGNFCSRFQ